MHSYNMELSFLSLPPELRVDIYDRVIFGCTRNRVVNAYRLQLVQLDEIAARNRCNCGHKEFPSHSDPRLKTPIDLSILRTCHFIHQEAATHFYQNMILRIALRACPDRWDFSCLRFFQTLPRKHWPLIKNVEIRSVLWDDWLSDDELLQDDGWRNAKLEDWAMIARFLHECRGLVSLVLRGLSILPCDIPTDLLHLEIHCPLSEQTMCKDHLLPIISRKQCTLIRFEPLESHHSVLERIQEDAVRIMRRSLDDSHAVNQSQEFSRFLDLPEHLRKTVYRYASVPVDGLIHPYIGAWFDDISRNLTPLLLANHQIYKETQEFFFDSTTWTPLSAHYTRTFFEFLHSLPKPVLNRLRHLKAFIEYGVDPYEHLSHLVAPIISDLHLETFLLQGSTFIDDVKSITDISTANPARKMLAPSKDTQRLLDALYFVQVDELDGSRRVDSRDDDVLSQWMQMHLQVYP